MGSHHLGLVVRLDDVNSLRHELVGDRTLVLELLLVNHDHVALLRVLHAFGLLLGSHIASVRS